MTREERNKKLKHFIACMKCEVSGKVCDDNCPTQYEAGNMGEIIDNLEVISKLLDQEPCENCISRQAAIEVAKQYWYKPDIAGALAELPPVQPKIKTGKWIYRNYNWYCSECGCTPKTLGYIGTAEFMKEHFKFCNHCGARMIEPQESEKE